MNKNNIKKLLNTSLKKSLTKPWITVILDLPSVQQKLTIVTIKYYPTKNVHL